MKHYLSITLFILFEASVVAQDCQKLSVSFLNTPLSEALEQLEDEAKFEVAYLDGLDTILVNASFSGECIQTIIENIIIGAKLHSTFFDNKIFITNDPLIRVLQSFLLEGEAEVDYVDYSGLLFEQDFGDGASDIVKIGDISKYDPLVQATLTGYVRSLETGEPVIGCSIYNADKEYSTTSNHFGYYELVLPTGRQELSLSYLGKSQVNANLIIYSSGSFNFDMPDDVVSLNEVIVSADRDFNTESVTAGLMKLNVESIKSVPVAFGENDIIKVNLSLPGVSSIGEGTAGFNVRGGNADQNLVLFDGMPIYNGSHFFGFFSVFNSDYISSSNLYKSSIPAKFGGRLSSVLDIKSREGSLSKISGRGGISPITLRYSMDIPIIENKLITIFSLRNTYSNWILRKSKNEDVQNAAPRFLDFSVKAKYLLGTKDMLETSYYSSFDSFKLLSDSSINYSNNAISLRYKRLISEDIDFNAFWSFSNYQYQLSFDDNPVDGFKIDYDLKDYSLKLEMNRFRGVNSTNFGIESKFYIVQPGALSAAGSESLVVNRELEKERGWENALYFSSILDIGKDLSLDIGLRYSSFSVLGPISSVQYSGNVRSLVNITDTIRSTRQFVTTNHGPEFRFSGRYKLNSNTSLKLAYNRNRQYISLLSNTVTVSPIDIWKLTDEYILPQIADQVSLGYYKNLSNGKYEFSVESYFKVLQNTLDFKVGSEFIMNEFIETDIIQGTGRAYGIEMLLKKRGGVFNGWISYTYSRSEVRFKGKSPTETINKGSFFPSNVDKPHNLSLITNYKLNKRYSFSLNLFYSSGRPITFPVGRYELGGKSFIQYSDRNQFRIPDYFRVDIGVSIEGNHKADKRVHGFWTISIYNLLGRDNAYSVFFRSSNSQLAGYQLSIFDRAIPSISYNFRF